MARRFERSAIIIALLSMFWAGEAAAHARLIKSAPAADAVLHHSPAAISLWFNEPPEVEFSSLQVLDAAAHVVFKGALSITPEPNGLNVQVPPLPAGDYQIRYRILSVDGHVLEGEFRFRIDASAPDR